METNLNNSNSTRPDMDGLFGSDVEYMDFKRARRQRCIAGNYAKVTLKDRHSCLYFSRPVAQVVAGKELKAMRIARNKLTGEYFIVFVKDDSYIPASVQYGRDGMAYSVRCVLRTMASWLMSLYGCTNEHMELELSENLSQTDDVATFRIEGATFRIGSDGDDD